MIRTSGLRKTGCRVNERWSFCKKCAPIVLNILKEYNIIYRTVGMCDLYNSIGHGEGKIDIGVFKATPYINLGIDYFIMFQICNDGRRHVIRGLNKLLQKQ